MIEPTDGDDGRADGHAPDQNLVRAAAQDDVLPFSDFVAPKPLAAEPPPTARWLAFAGILLGGLLGGLIGYGTADLLGAQPWLSAVAAIALAAGAALGVGIVAQLTLRAMNEWNAVQHPEDRRRDG